MCLAINGQHYRFMEQYLAHALLAKDDYSATLSEIAGYLQLNSGQYNQRRREDIIDLITSTIQDNRDIFDVFQNTQPELIVISLTKTVQSSVQTHPPYPGVDHHAKAQTSPRYQYLVPSPYTGHQSQTAEYFQVPLSCPQYTPAPQPPPIRALSKNNDASPSPSVTTNEFALCGKVTVWGQQIFPPSEDLPETTETRSFGRVLEK